MKIKLRGYAKRRAIFINDMLLEPFESQRLRNHSPDGFNWGYNGSGPAQLALAILLKGSELFKTKQSRVLLNYQDFKFEVISNLEMNKDFEIEIDLQKYLE